MPLFSRNSVKKSLTRVSNDNPYILFLVVPYPSAGTWSNKREYELIVEGISALIVECQDN